MNSNKQDWKPIESSNLAAYNYDKATATLNIEFKNGSRYSYLHVEEKLVKGMLKAKSKGSYFHTKIKENYEFKKLKPRREKVE